MRFLLVAQALVGLSVSLLGKDQPQWGQAWTRNMVSEERGLPSEFNPKTGLHLKWRAKLGTESHGSPIIADGRVYIGTNNGEPRNEKHKGDRGVLMCFDENTGAFLWQLVVPKRSEDPYLDWPNTGIASEATVDHGKVYIVSNRGEVLCLDPRGLANGNDGPFKDEAGHQTPKGEPLVETDKTDADIVWIFDMVAQAGIWTHDGAHSSILVDGDFLYVNTGTGVDNTHRKIRTPDAPTLIVLDKRSGQLLAREREGIAPNIFHATWSAPSMGEVNGRKRIFFAAGNGIVYGFEPLQNAPVPGEVATLKKVWQYDPDPNGPKTEVHRFTTNRREGPSNLYGMPVLVDDHLFICGGGDLWWGKNEAWLRCIDASGQGEVTPQAEIWNSPLERHTMSTPAVTGDLVFTADCGKVVHCVDRKTGQPLWTHELKSEIWASPFVADGKVYIGSRRGDFAVFAADKEKRVLSSVELGAPISATATAANGVLFVSTMTDLFAFKN
jgi:outer membrane protein assembly factor BamB